MGVKKKKNGESVQNGGIKPHHETNGNIKETFPDPFAVTWAEKYSAGFEKVWSKIPKFLGAFIVTAAICTMGLGISGDWLLILVHSLKQYRGNLAEDLDINNVDGLIESLRLKNFSYFWLGAAFVSYIIYYGIGGFLHWYFYVRQRDRPHEWKCQPTKFMSPELERHEIIFGSLTLLLNSTTTAMVACYISNGGYSTIYYNISDYPTWWFFLQFVVIFIYQLHGTYRRKDRVYTEDTFYGKGKQLTEVTAEELKADIEERKSENPKAYRGDKLVYILSDKDLQEQDIKTSAIRKKKKYY
ncbi:sterol desaturase [Holotrichia oblita]|uniref:Sterol desaturase n=1 Tax=Holotrichia oblita TaxID=644536 RepID=A0ACB9SZ15_HOLOL|nr:sterol desaturase [Holotrichia oblita]